ncbi:MAG TPA: FixH family protein [Gemmatimonadaceae bacterium]|nr:FixH family protein [Gemmatimonadaceae bacterium]
MRSLTRSVTRSVTRSLTTAIATAVATGLLTGCMLLARAPQDLDYSRTRTSEAGRYRVTIHPPGDTIPQGKLHRWTLHVETAAGTPVDSGTFVVDGGMPQHGHGLPTKPRVTRALGSGDHLVEGMKFNMGGWWVVKLRVDAGAGRDSVVFNVKL